MGTENMLLLPEITHSLRVGFSLKAECTPFLLQCFPLAKDFYLIVVQQEIAPKSFFLFYSL